MNNRGLTKEDMYQIFCNWAYRAWDRERHLPQSMVIFTEGGYSTEYCAVEGRQYTLERIPDTAEDVRQLFKERYGAQLGQIKKVEFRCRNNSVQFHFKEGRL